MEYISTRDENRRLCAAQAIAAGLSPEGGLFLPEELPSFSPEEIQEMMDMDYQERAALVLSRFLPDFSREELAEYAGKAYASPKFPHSPAPVTSLKSGPHILELFHGPTCAFKDFALQMLPFLLTASLKKTGVQETVVILTATSGDTGKAALEGFADVEGTKIGVFYPDGGTSEMQRLQMVTQSGENVAVFAAAGNFDDAQNGVKKIFTDGTFAEELKQQGFLLSSANSINWGRLVPQVAYYFSAYCDLCKQDHLTFGEKLNVTVPTGNFGNILAAYLAKQCGLPLGKLICASNRNRVLTDFLSTGVYDRNREFYMTTSPSMDILISSNLERLLYLSGGQPLVQQCMEALQQQGKYEVEPEILAQLQETFACGCADDYETAQEIRWTYERDGYLCDPHTAVALHVYEQYTQQTGDSAPVLIASTASPFKFAGTVLEALGHEASPDPFQALEQLSHIAGQPVPEALVSLADRPVRFNQVITPANMKAAVTEWLSK